MTITAIVYVSIAGILIYRWLAPWTNEQLTCAAVAKADSVYLGQLPPSIFEMSFVFAAVILVVTQAHQAEPEAVIAGLALFLAAGSRIMHSLLHLNASTLIMRRTVPQAAYAFSLGDDLGAIMSVKTSSLAHLDGAAAEEGSTVGSQRNFVVTISVDSVTYRYPGAEKDAIRGVSLRVQPGDTVALVGESGSGKSPLVDDIFGLTQPDTGHLSLVGVPPAYVPVLWPGAAGSVPPHGTLIEASIRSSVAVDAREEELDDSAVWDALRWANAADFVPRLPKELDEPVREWGVRLSGGQRQRIGLARALYTKSNLLVLDEARSALDAESEQAVIEAFAEPARSIATIIIAHRLATIRSASKVPFLERGAIAACGTFDEVKRDSVACRRYLQILGLD